MIKDKNLVKSKCILNTPVVLAGSERFNHLKGKSLKEFSKVPLILPCTSLEIRHKLELEFTRYRLDLNIIGEIDDTIIKKNMALAGNGIIPIMKEPIKDYVDSGQLHILSEELEVGEEIWFMSARSKMPNDIVEDLIKNFNF